MIGRANLRGTLIMAATLSLMGCGKSAPAPTNKTPVQITHYPARPSVKPPAFHLFHQTDNTLTLVTGDHATNTQIAAILWQLRDAANSHTFDGLHLPQAFVDKRDPIVWFHIYRGEKCASEKYTTGKYPCGASYHAAGEFTYGSFKDPNRTDGQVLLDANKSTTLWNPNANAARK